MFRSFLEALFGGFVSPSLTFAEQLAKYDVIKTINECGENRYIAVEKQDTDDVDILITKCKRLLSFVESRGLDSRYARVLRLIKHCAEEGEDPETLFADYERVKKRVMGRSERSLSSLDVRHG